MVFLLMPPVNYPDSKFFPDCKHGLRILLSLRRPSGAIRRYSDVFIHDPLVKLLHIDMIKLSCISREIRILRLILQYPPRKCTPRIPRRLSFAPQLRSSLLLPSSDLNLRPICNRDTPSRPRCASIAYTHTRLAVRWSPVLLSCCLR